MALNSSGPISLAGTTAGQSIELENGGNGTTQISLNDTAVRSLAGVTTPNSTIIMPTNFYGKSNRVAISYTFSANTANASLNLSSIGGYSAGKSDITVTINNGVYLYATSTGGYALALSGATTGDTVTIVNNGYIMGQGGNGGGRYSSGGPTLQPTSGGPAINIASVGVSGITITNTSGYIGGGGGGGAHDAPVGSSGNCGGGGGAGGGGAGGAYYSSYASGGTGGSIGSSGTTGGQSTYYCGCAGYTTYFGGGGGGGRIMPGTGGAGGYTSTSYGSGGGAGGGGGNVDADGGSSNRGGTGGSAGNAGGNATYAGTGQGTSGGGGGYGASGGQGKSGGNETINGASGGKAINTSGKTITWTGGASSSSRAYGTVS